jgi:hypothetical protein
LVIWNYFSPFWYVREIKIWQPCSSRQFFCAALVVAADVRIDVFSFLGKCETISADPPISSCLGVAWRTQLPNQP